MNKKDDLTLLIITGLSGAGKTHAIRALEDLGYFCVDNLLPALLPKFTELMKQAETITQAALVIDVRGGRFFDDMSQALRDLRKQGISYEILYLEASTEVLVNRFKETRRRHPLSSEGRLLEDILLEKERLEELRGMANKIIDTSAMATSEFKNLINELYGPQDEKGRMKISVLSFGYKYGIPLDADLVIDVRFLPNPFYISEMREQTGCEQGVKDYVLKSSVTAEFLAKYVDLLKYLLPHYLNEGKTHLVIAIGCTGGQHRSVTLANTIGDMLSVSEYKVTVRHRDVNKRGAGGEPV